MNIQAIKRESHRRIREELPLARRLTAISVGVALAATLAAAFVSQLTAGYQGEGGLSGMGAARLLRTLEETLGLGVQLLLPFWTVGLVSAMLRLVRTGSADKKQLTEGLRRFPVFLRLNLLQTLILLAISFLLYTPSFLLFSLTPWGRKYQQAVASVEVLTQEALNQLIPMMIPMIVIYLVLVFGVYLAINYRLRLAQYHVLSGCDRVLVAMTISVKQMRGRVWGLVKLDLSYWWYYASTIALVLVCYLDVIGELLGKPLPWEGNIAYWVCYLGYAVGSFVLDVLAKPYVEGARAGFFLAVNQ